jgi:hypothetical protein
LLTLDEWKDIFFPELVKKYNFGSGSGCALSFWGSTGDFTSMKNAMPLPPDRQRQQG